MNEREREEFREKEGYSGYSEYTDDDMAGSVQEQRTEDLRSKSPEELEDEIDRIRKDMDATLSSIEKRLSPGEIIDRSLHYFQRGPGEYMANLGNSIKEKPLPTALVGLSLGWLMLADSGRAPGRFSVAQTSHRSGETRKKMQEARGKVSEATQRAKEKMGDVSHAVSDRMHRMSEKAHGTRESAGEWGHRVGDFSHRSGERLHQAQSNFAKAVEEQPLILGVLGVAAGALIGAMLPHTRQEDATLGPAKERLKEQVAETGREQMAKAQAVAAAATKSVREEADRQLH